MTKDRCSTDHVIQILLQISCDLESAKDQLSKLDSAVGDGDLGVTMARGSQALRDGLADSSPDIGRVLVRAGMDFSSAASGTMGVLLGSALMEAGKVALGRTSLGLSDVAAMTRAAADSVQRRGHAGAGDKTMLDALLPACDALEAAVREQLSVLEGFQRASSAADAGVEKTRDMKAGFGRARWLGERTIGHPDPGATVISLILGSILASLDEISRS